MNNLTWIFEQSKDFFKKQSDTFDYFGLTYLGVEISNTSMWDEELDLVKIGVRSQTFDFYLEISFIEENRQRTDKLVIYSSTDDISLGDSSLLFERHTFVEFEKNIRRCLKGTTFKDPLAVEELPRISPSTLELEGLLGSRKDYESRSAYMENYLEVAKEWEEQEGSAAEEFSESCKTIAEALSFIGSEISLEKMRSEPPKLNPRLGHTDTVF
jgi:hypothetical protein